MDSPILDQVFGRISKAGLAKLLHLTRGAVSQWSSIPAKHVLKIEGVTGISRYKLRPDIYGIEPATPSDGVDTATPDLFAPANSAQREEAA